jgi:hypothetical protein
VDATVEQAEAIRRAGATLVRVAVDSPKDVEALFKPIREAASSRGKFESFSSSVIQLGSPLCQTRPGNPTPGRKTVSWLRTSKSLAAISARRHTSAQRSAFVSSSTYHKAPTSQPVASQIAWRILGDASPGDADSARMRVTS